MSAILSIEIMKKSPNSETFRAKKQKRYLYIAVGGVLGSSSVRRPGRPSDHLWGKRATPTSISVRMRHKIPGNILTGVLVDQTAPLFLSSPRLSFGLRRARFFYSRTTATNTASPTTVTAATTTAAATVVAVAVAAAPVPPPAPAIIAAAASIPVAAAAAPLGNINLFS